MATDIEVIVLEEELMQSLYDNPSKLEYLILQIHKQNKFLNHLNKKIEQMTLDISALQTAVAANTTAINNAVAALQSPQTSQSDIDAITSTVTTNTTALVAATPTPPTAG